MIMPLGPRRWTAIGSAVACLALSLVLSTPTPAAAISGRRPLAVVLCKFTDLTNEPQSVSYFERLFSEKGAALPAVFDYWKTVSYGALDLTGTVVKGWYTVTNTTAAQWGALSRADKIDKCASQARNDLDFNAFSGVVVLTNRADGVEDLFGGKPATTIAGTTYASLGRMLAASNAPLDAIFHETGHSYLLDHSRTLSQQYAYDNAGNKTGTQSDYGDPYDVMSCLNCRTTPSAQGAGGPGLNVVQLDTAGWLPANRELRNFDNTSCRQQTIQMAAVNHPEAPGFLEARIPAAVAINHATESTVSDYYTVELRNQTGWDAGIRGDITLIHLHGADGRSYLVDESGTAAGTYYPIGGFDQALLNSGVAGAAYVDAARKAWVAVNRVDSAGHTATVTLGACKIKVSAAYLGATSGDFSDRVTLKGRLVVRDTTAPVPLHPVTLSLGTQQCSATTDTAGEASCPVVIAQHPGTVVADMRFAGDPAYEAGTAATSFTINREGTALTYGGPLTADYHDELQASAILVDPDGDGPIAGKPVSFTLGVGDTCSAPTNASGVATCPITPTQPSGAYSMVASFAGDVDYLASADAKPFTITREQTTLSYDGPFQVANDAPAVLRGTLKEDGVTPIAGRMVTFALGAGASAQGCSGQTDGAGRAQCTIPAVRQPDSASMTLAVKDDFAGDRYYLPSNAAASVRLLYYTGRAFGVSANLLGVPITTTSDTGSIRTAARSQTRRSILSALIPWTAGAGSDTNVTTGLGSSKAEAKVATLTIGVPAVPVIQVAGVAASSTSSCLAATGSTTIVSLRIGGVAYPVDHLAPNRSLDVAGLRIVLNEQLPVAGADHGLVVNALHVWLPGAIDFVVASTQSDIHNCP